MLSRYQIGPTNMEYIYGHEGLCWQPQTHFFSEIQSNPIMEKKHFFTDESSKMIDVPYFQLVFEKKRRPRFAYSSYQASIWNLF